MKVLALLLVARVAHADDVGYATLDRQDGATKLTAQVSYLSLPNAGQFAQIDLAGQYVKPTFGGGFYAQVPLAYESDTGGNSTTSLGGLEVGGIYQSPAGVTLHAGLVLPTADITGQALLTSSIARIGDVVQVLPNATVLRTGAAYAFRACQIFGRIELGLDAPLSVEATGSNPFDGQVLHLDAALGVDADDFTLAVETVNVFGIGTSSPAFDVVAATMRIRAGTTRPYVALVVPLDNQQNEPKLAVTAGVEVRFSGSR